MIPLWFFLALSASLCAAGGMYMHQRMQGSAAASAVWIKIVALMIATPVLFRVGLPDQPMFYVFTAAAAVIWCFNDLIYFEAVKKHGAALLSRLSPLGLILAFAVWFVLHPDLLSKYMDDPLRFAGVCATLTLTVVCALFLKRCPVSWNALKDIWPIIIAAMLGVLLIKSAVDYAPRDQGVFGYVGFEAGLMLIFYLIYFSIKRRDAAKEIFSLQGLRTGGTVAAFIVTGIILRTYAMKNVDHPAFVTMISMLDVIWLIILSRLSGWKDDSNKIAGLGIVLAALALAFLKLR